MTTVISVKFRGGNKLYYFDPAGFDIKERDGVIVETARGTEFGDVAHGPQEVPEEQILAPLKSVQRVATQKDREMRDMYIAKEAEALRVCVEKIRSHKLDMKLVSAEYAFNGAKIAFYFTADGRVDFRELVKDLASVFKTRIELRQIGVRDEAKMLGGLGCCGRPVCCQAFLSDFQPVSIKMAKEQSLSLSPTKISGICGRLMCCLKYEQDCYESMRKQMPKVGKEVGTPGNGTGTVIENNVLTEKTKVKLVLPDGSIDIKEYPFRQLSFRNSKGEQNIVESPVAPVDEWSDIPTELLTEEAADRQERQSLPVEVVAQPEQNGESSKQAKQSQPSKQAEQPNPSKQSEKKVPESGNSTARRRRRRRPPKKD